ncbi:hypothetical protein DAPPUDRAFT_257001 [Daphnia pulex]|uniref:Uncharacterized protein n=1 Tax=Daphnia pulex TaxID=6669 RepID=E9HCN7_DAPPU|nr:hypothetical protein DAPPUDRAFT_257001 [Daphnia pulex]|eukprot:EFX70508.1 hypothetical protein DAPPUDRAFT_257001 [Daphnia pulex]
MVQVLNVVLAFIACIHAILDWIWFEMAEYFESDTETEIEPEFNPEPSQNRVPETNLMQKQCSQIRIITLPIMWKPDQVSALPDTVLPDTVLPDTTLPDAVLIPESFYSDEGLTALPECESVGRIFQNSEIEPESNPEPSQNRVPETNLMQKQCSQIRIILPLPIMWKPDQVSALPDSMSKLSMDENTEILSTVDQFPATTTVTEEYLRNLENDHQYLKNQIGIFQQSFQNFSAVVQDFEEMIQGKERLEEEVKFLKETVAEYESDKRNSHPQEKPDFDEMQLLKNDNSKLKSDLETSAAALSLKMEEIEQMTVTTYELNQKFKKTTLENDELIFKLATSRNMGPTFQSDFQKIGSKLTKEIAELRDQLTRKQNILDEREATLDQKVEELHKLQAELKLAQQKNLALTSLNGQLETELAELQSTTQVIQAEFRRMSVESDSTFLSAEEVRKLADERQVANDLLRSNLTQLKTELTALESQIGELKKEKAVQLGNASYESVSRRFQPLEKPDSNEIQLLKDDNSKLKSDLETSATELSLKLVEIQRLTAVTKELNQKLKKKMLKNDELILKLATLRSTASTSQDDFHKIETKLTKEITELKDLLTSQQKISEEKETILESTIQDNKVAGRKVKEIHKLELEQAQQKNLALTSLNEQLQTEFNEMKRRTEVIEAELRHVSEARDAAYVFVEKATKLAEGSAQLADKRKVENDLLVSNITQLKAELTASESQIDELKKQKADQLNASTEFQLRNELANLKADTTHLQNETLSELERIKDKNSVLNANLTSVKESLAEESAKTNELITRNLELASENSMLKSLNNDDLKKEAENCRMELDRMKQSVILGVPKFLLVLSSKQKTTKLAEEQVEALSEALAALQEAVVHTEDAAKATKTEQESISSQHATKTKTTPKTRTLIGKLLAKRKIEKLEQSEDGFANLLEITGLQMVERANDLQDQANIIKAKGKALKKQAKTRK